MTTEAGGYRVDVAPNLFEPNECVNLPQLLNADVALGLACISVSRRVEPLQRSDLMWSCVERARELFLSRVGLWTCWLFACVCGDDSRITRHQGLWKVLAKQGLPPRKRSFRKVGLKSASTAPPALSTHESPAFAL